MLKIQCSVGDTWCHSLLVVFRAGNLVMSDTLSTGQWNIVMSDTLSTGQWNIVMSDTLSTGQWNIVMSDTLSTGQWNIVMSDTLSTGQWNIVMSDTLSTGQWNIVMSDTLSTGHRSIVMSYTVCWVSRVDITLRADSRFVPSQWETALLCNDIFQWLGASQESALTLIPCWYGACQPLTILVSCHVVKMESMPDLQISYGDLI